MQKVFLSILILFFSIQATAQENVADIAHAFIKSVKNNDLALIQKHFVAGQIAYNILPKEAVGMSRKEQNTKYMKPLQQGFQEKFEDIQQLIKNKNISVRNIDLQSYKLEKRKVASPSKLQAMSLFFDYKGDELIIPIAVVELDEKWYILEILDTENIFK